MSDDRYGTVATGVLMMTAGFLIALHNGGYVDARTLRPWWPLLLLVPAGQALFARRACGRRWLGASIWVAASVLLLLYMQGYPVLRVSVLAPLVFIGGGAYLLWRGPSDAGRRGDA